MALTLLLVVAATAKELPSPVTLGADGKLVYAAEPNGDRIIDFSHAGYGGGGVPLPEVSARVQVEAADGDDGARIQAAIDHVAQLAPDADGIRGAVLLARGRFEIAGQLKITTSGVVLRGGGMDTDGTVLVATGTDRRALIEIAGRDVREGTGEPISIIDEYVPAGAVRLRVALPGAFAAGARVTIERPSPEAWIAHVDMDDAPARQPYRWKAGAFNVRWDRVVIAVDGDRLTLDAPLTVALDAKFGGATVMPFVRDGWIENVGVEHLRCESAFDASNLLDEEHAWNAIDLHAVRDGWIASVTGVHFAGSVVQVGARTARVTVQDCASLAPVSEHGGYRRLAFHTRGQQTLFLRCHSESGRHDFSVGYLAAGPNVFLECTTRESTGFSGPVGSWASGVLFDNVKVDGAALRIDNLETWNQGVGWNAANSVLWSSSAAQIICRSPPGAGNWAVGVWGQFLGDGRWSQTNEFMTPASLYRAQLAERLGTAALAALEPSKKRAGPDLVSAPQASPPTARTQGPALHESRTYILTLTDGWLTANRALLTGRQSTGAWWLGRLEPARAAEFGPALTRFAPGRAGPGLTDELPSVVAAMRTNDQVAFRHHYGLWYDRRRIDHEMIRRPDGDVSPPFYEQPFARSGQGHAWDGLSRYDLTKYNPWYFGRLREFAALGRQAGVVLINEMYFQHNILESGAHWVDCPWRPVNNINDTGFTEPPPFTGDTIKMAAEFYDVTHPLRRELHRAYIRQCLANLADEPNVIHTLSAENSGPLPFLQFWLDVIAEWERETGQHPLLALSAPKDVQDAILADAPRAPVVDVIDLAYWFRTDAGAEFAPAGGTTLAPRQHARLWKGGRPDGASIAGMVREYRARFPDKAVISNLAEADGWAFVAAGGSFPKVPRTTDATLLAALATMRPVASADGTLRLARGEEELFVFAPASVGEFKLAGEPGDYVWRAVDLETGAVRAVTRGDVNRRPAAFWIVRK